MLCYVNYRFINLSTQCDINIEIIIPTEKYRFKIDIERDVKFRLNINILFYSKQQSKNCVLKFQELNLFLLAIINEQWIFFWNNGRVWKKLN